MSSLRNQAGSSRIFASQSISIGSTAATSTAVFGSQSVQIRAISTQAATLLIGDSPSVSSTVILQTGTPIPANLPEYFSVSAGQRLSAITSSTSAVLY